MPDAEPDQKIRIKLISSKGHEVLFQVKPSTKLGTVMRAYCTRLNMRLETTRFIFDGNRLNEGLLVSESELENDDIIDVCEEQVGGYSA
jgi:small ubiquitin-related modifier